MAKKQTSSISPFEVAVSRWVRDIAGEVVATKIMPVDYVLDGGIRTGRIVEVFGPEQSGKTTLMLHIVRSFLESKDGKVVYVDTEHSIDANWALLNGVDFSDKRVVLIQPSSTNEALAAVEQLSKYKEVCLLVLDSLPALALEEELEAEDYHSAQPGLLARAFNRTLRVLTSTLPANNSVFVFSNQLRSSMAMYGSPETTPGGRMKNYAASYRLEIRKSDWIGTKQDAHGIVSTVRAIKNKCGQPYRAAEIYITSKGLDVELSNFNMLVSLGIIQRNGPTFVIDNTTFKSKAEILAYLKQNRDTVYTKFSEKFRVMTDEAVEHQEEAAQQ